VTWGTRACSLFAALSQGDRVQILPPQLVPVAQGLLRQQGFDPNIFAPDGSLKAEGIVNIFYDTVTVRTAVTPDLVFPISATGEPPSPAMQELMNQLRPTVTLSGRAGTVTVSPYGTPQGARSWWPLALFGVGSVAFLGWALFGR
jgi:hypothetical protein